MSTNTELPKMANPNARTGSDEHLQGLLERINRLAAGEEPASSARLSDPIPSQASVPPQPVATPKASTPRNSSAVAPQAPAPNSSAGFSNQVGSAPQNSKPSDPDCPWRPIEPQSLAEAEVTETLLEQLITKFLFARGEATGRTIASQARMPFGLTEDVLRRMKYEQIIGYKDAVEMNDYVYVLSDLGRERARRFSRDCAYYGSAPVSLSQYVESVKQQSLQYQNPSQQDLEQAFEDLLINPQMFRRLGPAINSGRGMFLFGFPGNGKTSIAERVTRCFGKYIYVPRAINVDGELIRVYDPNHHEEVPPPPNNELIEKERVDGRWVRIKRPTIVVGGELTMQNLELQANLANGTSEASIQLKSNCGALVIDDFGRQKMSTDELLNRWIVPLEKRYDFLNLPSGKSIQVPFDQLIVFSTNLEPKDLVDDAFLRRIPYKIEVLDPTEEEFIQLFEIMCPILGFEYREKPIKLLIEKHYKAVNRPFRCCQPRDLLLQVRNDCLYRRMDLELTEHKFDFAVENYFAVM